jgi:hypothetical protein
MRHGVGRQVGAQVARIRPTAPASSLVEQHHPIERRVEEPPPGGACARTGPAVKHQSRLAERVAANLPIDEMALTDIEHPRANGVISG